MIPTPIESRDMAEQLLEEETVTEKAAERAKPVDCGKKTCHRYRFCWACEHWLGCKEKPLGTCFDCMTKDCPDYVKAAEECEICKIPGVE